MANRDGLRPERDGRAVASPTATRASRTITPDSSASSGLRSISLTSGQVRGELREPGQHQANRLAVGGGDVAIAVEHARHASPADQIVGEPEIKRRQRQRLVVDDLDRGAASAEHDDRSEGLVVGEAGDQLARLAGARSWDEWSRR